ncbi:unnamed protein product [Durusdinium trenchii]|uniref:Ubiquitin-like domain-containing protein n=3 Tax=Durusdinium trenchii TaxID=1381693 RepID=A0ABP0P723_9DINO
MSYHALPMETSNPAMEEVPNLEVLEQLELLARPMKGAMPLRKEITLMREKVLDLARRIKETKDSELVEVHVQLLSGTILGSWALPRQSKVSDVMDRVSDIAEEGKAVSKLVFGDILDEDSTLEGCGIDEGDVLTVTFQPCAFRVTGAGAMEVNGYYAKSERVQNGAPVFINKNGIILFKYIMRRGTPYWYFTKDGHPADDSKGDYYRVQTDAASPPTDGWNTKSCPLGTGTCPAVQPMDVEYKPSPPPNGAVATDEADNLDLF